MDHAIGFGVRSVSRTIAITSELIAGQKGKESSRARNYAAGRLQHDHDGDSAANEDLTQIAWELDDAGEQASEVTTEQQSSAEDSTLVDTEHVTQYIAHQYENQLQTNDTFTVQPLPMAVILPQRRPRDRQRGFVRAYAPILGEYSGISQEMFLEFLDSWNKASRTSPIFDVINLACFGVSMMPHAVAIAVAGTVGTMASIGKELQHRYRSNKYLDTVNESLFKPRGLFAMVMTFKPEMPDDPILQADLTNPTSTTLTKVLDKQNSNKVKQILYRLRQSSGVAEGDAQVPDCAPLVYPSLDLALTSNAITRTSALKRNAAAVQDYLDRRAQADFIISNPNSKIAKALPPQQKPFVNRYCDPDHPVNNNSIFSLLTGGTFDPIGIGRIWNAEAKAKKNGEPPLNEQEKHDAFMGRKVRGRPAGTPSKTLPIIGKMLKKDVLYLIIVNLPTDGEIASVRHVFEG